MKKVQQHDDILPMAQIESYALVAQQRYHRSLWSKPDSKENEEKAEGAPESLLQRAEGIPSSLSELCCQMQQRLTRCAVPQPSPEDKEALETVMMFELGLIWQDLRVSKPEPTLTWSENQVLHHRTFTEVLRLCEQLYLSYLHLQQSMRRRAVFTDDANRSRLAAKLASDFTSVLNLHSIRRGIAAEIKVKRKAAQSHSKQNTGEEYQPPITDTSIVSEKLMLSLPKGKMRQLSRQHRLSIQKDIAEIKEKIGKLDLEHVYELMPYRLEKIVNLDRSKVEGKCPDEALPTVCTGDEVCDVSDGLYCRLKGCNSMPDLTRETLLDELEMKAPPPRPQSPLVLMVISTPATQKQRFSPEEDLKRLLQDDLPIENADPDVDIPPLIKARCYNSSAKLQRLQADLQRLRQKRERLSKSREPQRKAEHPQAEVVSVPISCHTTARMVVARVSDRVEPEKINIDLFPPVYNDVGREIEVSSVQWMDRNLFAGAEIKEVCKELSKYLMQRYLSFELDPLFEQYMTKADLNLKKKTGNRLINSALKNNISSKKRAEAPVDHKKPTDMSSRAYTAWFQWWKSHLSLDDYLKYLASQQVDFLGVVFHLVENEVKKDSEEEKLKILQQQRDEKKRARAMKIEALKNKKQEYIMGVWNVNSVLLGGLWNDPVLEEEESPEEEAAPLKQEQKEADPDQLKTRLERIWTALCLPYGLRVDMAIKYSSHAYRDQLEKAIIAWEQAARLIQQREAILSKLEMFEWEASDPNRFSHPGYRGTSIARMDESREREQMNAQMSSIEKDLTKVLSEISDCFRDNVTYRGRPYREKMRWDRTEMLYWLQQERRVQALERVVTKRRFLPARLPPLEQPHPTPQICSPNDPLLVYGDKLQISPATSHIQLSDLNLSSLNE